MVEFVPRRKQVSKAKINKPSAMIQTSVKGLTLTQRKLINVLIKVAQDKGNFEEYTLPIVATKKMCGITQVGNDDLKQQMLALQDVKIIFNYLGKDNEVWESNVLLPRVRIEPNTGIIKFEFTSFIRKQILNPAMYAPLDLLTIACFKSTYTVILYEFLRDYLDSPQIPVLTIDQFRTLMGIEPDCYQEFKYLKRDIVDRAVDEVNEKTDVSCICEVVLAGRKCTHLKFQAIRKQARPMLPGPRPALPAGVLTVLPEKHHTEAVFDALRPYCVEPFDEAFVTSNIRYALGKAKRNFPFYLSKALAGDFAKAQREGEGQVRKINDRAAEEHRREIEEQERVDREGKLLYEQVLASEPARIEALEDEVRAELRAEGSPFIAAGQVRSRIFERLLGIDRTKDAKQESLF